MARTSSKKKDTDLEARFAEYDAYRERNGFDDSVFEAYVRAISYAIFTENDLAYGRKKIKEVRKIADKALKNTKFKTFWDLEAWAQRNEQNVNFIEYYYQLYLMESFWSFEAYIFYLERDRQQSKRFYLPRMNPLQTVVQDLEDLANRKIKFLGISLPARVGKSTLCIYFLTWIGMKRPNSNSAMGGHSGVLTKGFYKELMNIFDTPEYRFIEIYKFWNRGETAAVTDKSAEDLTINLGKPNRFSTITCRSIDATWTGAVNISVLGLLYVDDLVRDREHSLSPTRMDNTWQEYLNKMVDRKVGSELTPDMDLGYDVDVENHFAGACELMVGTLWNVYDPLYRLEQLYGKDPLYRFRKIPALNEKDESNFDYPINGFTTEYYREMRERLDEPEWFAKYQQAPYVREGLLYKKNELNYFNGECPDGRTIAVLDPAVGGGDFLSMLVIRIVGKKNYIIDWLYTNETKGKTIPAICSKIIFHNITELHYERNGIGRAFEEDVTKALHERNFYRCKSNPFNAPEGMSKEDKILGYSDWVKSNLWFIDEEAKSTTYARSNDYIRALNDMFIYTTVGKNKHDDSVDNLAQAARVFEKQSNGSVDIILNPFR